MRRVRFRSITCQHGISSILETQPQGEPQRHVREDEVRRNSCGVEISFNKRQSKTWGRAASSHRDSLVKASIVHQNHAEVFASRAGHNDAVYDVVGLDLDGRHGRDGFGDERNEVGFTAYVGHVTCRWRERR